MAGSRCILMSFMYVFLSHKSVVTASCLCTHKILPKGAQPFACLSPLLTPHPRDPVAVTHRLDRNQRESIKHKP